MKSFLASAFLSMALFSPGLGFADEPKKEPTPEELEAARILFGQGQDAYNNGDFTKALESYQKAYTIAQKPSILFNIGQCNRKLGRYDDASKNYKQFLQSDPETQYKGEVEYKIAEAADQLGNKQEALDYYQKYLADKVADDPNEAQAKTRIEALKKELETKGPNGPTPDERSDGFVSRVLSQPLGKAAIGTGAVSAAMGAAAWKFKGDDKKCQDSGQCEVDKDSAKYKLRVTSSISDVFLLSTVALVVVASIQGKPTPEATKPTTSLRLIPTTTGGFVTFSFTPAP